MSARAPKVSVVITCYNYGRYVQIAIESALAQTYSNIEVIVVDDGSTDDTPIVLDRYAGRIVRIAQENRGHVAAVNRGYAASTGDAVLFLDADDALRPDAIAEVVGAWEEHCTKVQFELDVVDAEGRFLRRFCNYVEGYDADRVEHEFARFGTYVWPVLSGNLYSRKYLERLMPLSVARAPDGFLNTLAPLYGRVRVVAKTLGYYRLHDTNLNYHGVTATDYGARFSRRVSLRLSEIEALRRHAANMNTRLPPGNLLDHDLTFVNYRLMLKRLGVIYEGASLDRTFGLWRKGIATLFNRPLPARLKLAHGLWLSALLCSPTPLAQRLIDARFQRTPLFGAHRKVAALRDADRDGRPARQSA